MQGLDGMGLVGCQIAFFTKMIKTLVRGTGQKLSVCKPVAILVYLQYIAWSMSNDYTTNDWRILANTKIAEEMS